MQNDDIITDESFAPDGDGQAAADSSGSETSADALTLGELNATLGKDFPTKEAALKSIKDTASYVGRRKEDIIREAGNNVDPNQFVTKTDFDNAMFFKDHPEYGESRDLITRLQQPGQSLSEVVKDPTLSSLFEKAKASDELVKSKSILQSNPRLGAVTDKMTNAREASSKGDYSGATNSAVGAVIDAFELV